MTQLIINIEDVKILPSLRKVLGAMQGVSIAGQTTSSENGLDLAIADAKAGRVTHYDSVEAMFEELGI